MLTNTLSNAVWQNQMSSKTYGLDSSPLGKIEIFEFSVNELHSEPKSSHKSRDNLETATSSYLILVHMNKITFSLN